MKQLFTFLILFGMLHSLSAQKEETVFNTYGGINLTGIWVGSYSSLADFKDDYNISNRGALAFEFNKDFLIGWAGYKDDLTSTGNDVKLSGNDLFLGYVPNSHKVFHPLIYLQGGSGKLEIEDVGSDRLLVIQPSLGGEVNIARWFRLGIDAGYRFYSGANLNGISNSDLAGPTLGIRMKFGWSWGDRHGNRNSDWED